MQDLEVALGGSVVGREYCGCVLGEFLGEGWVECSADGGRDFLAVSGD